MPDTIDFTDIVQRRVEPTTYDSLLAVVSSVTEHDDPNDFSNHEVNAISITNEEHFRDVPVHVSRMGESYVPQPGDFVEIDFLFGNTQQPYVSGYAYSDQNRAPLGRSGHYRQRFGDGSPYLFIEAETSDHSAGTPDVVRMGKKSDGLSDPSDTIEIDDSGSQPVVTVKTEGKVVVEDDEGGSITVDGGTVTADGTTVTLGTGGTFVLKDVTVSTTKDVDGHVTDVTLNKTRSSKVETE